MGVVHKDLSFSYFDTNRTQFILDGVMFKLMPEEITIPAMVDGFPVCAIYQQLFYFSDKARIKKIYIPDSVRWIGGQAFKDCKNLESVVFYKTTAPAAILEIGNEAFAGCEKLWQFVCPVHAAIGDYAFENCRQLQHLEATFVSVGKYGFHYCKNISSITFGRNAIWEDNSFVDCKRVQHIYFLGSLARHMLKYPTKLRFLQNKEIVVHSDFNCMDLAYEGVSIIVR